MMNKSHYETLIDCLTTLGEIKADINTLESIRADTKPPTRHAHSNYDDYANYFVALDTHKETMRDYTTRIDTLEAEYNRELSSLNDVIKSHIFENVDQETIKGDYIVVIYSVLSIASIMFHELATTPLVKFSRASTETEDQAP